MNRRRFAVYGLGVIVCVIGGISAFCNDNGASILGYSKHSWMLASIIAMILYFAFICLLWRCPLCHSFLGFSNIMGSYCSHCNAALIEVAKKPGFTKSQEEARLKDRLEIYYDREQLKGVWAILLITTAASIAVNIWGNMSKIERAIYFFGLLPFHLLFIYIGLRLFYDQYFKPNKPSMILSEEGITFPELYDSPILWKYFESFECRKSKYNDGSLHAKLNIAFKVNIKQPIMKRLLTSTAYRVKERTIIFPCCFIIPTSDKIAEYITKKGFSFSYHVYEA